jgi:glycosyltransferase involved in cell wall biosynthesis
LVCLANFAPGKGQSVVVEAVATLRRQFPTLRAVLAGDGPTRHEVQDLVGRLGVSDIVTLPGAIDQPWTLLGAADVFVLASDIEGLPLVVLEALSQGTPVVATDVGGMPEAVVPGVTGELVAPRQPGELAAALGKVLADPEYRKKMAAAARAMYEERFTMEVMLRRHEQVYEEVLARR